MKVKKEYIAYHVINFKTSVISMKKVINVQYQIAFYQMSLNKRNTISLNPKINHFQLNDRNSYDRKEVFVLM